MSIAERLPTTQQTETLDQLRPLYKLVNVPQIIEFLEQNPQLVPFLKVARPKLGEYFPKGEFSLEVRFDPEMSEWTTLFIFGITTLEVAEVIAQSDKFFFEWWADADVYGGKVNYSMS